MCELPTPHPHQQAMIDECRSAFREYGAVLMQLATGGGKTFMASLMSVLAEKKGGVIWFVCHRREILVASVKAFQKVGLKFGVVASGFTGDRRQKVQICSIDTLRHRHGTLPPPTLIIWDECQHMAAKTWGDLMAAFPKAKHLGLSATPQRLDGTGLGKWFETMVQGPSMAWLIKNGFLSDYRYFAPSAPDLTGVHTVAGDYNKHELERAVDRPKLTGDAVSHYLRLAPGCRAIVFCVSIKHSLSVVEKFQAAGIRAAHVDGTTPTEARDRAVRDLTEGRIDVLSNVDIFTEGFDLPSLDAVVLLRPTKSLSLYLQMVGRGLRAAAGKSETIILDHAGCAAIHGLPDDDREWSLAGRQRRTRGSSSDEPAVQVRQCPACYSVHKPSPTCPRCGHEYPALGRSIEELEGELQEMQRMAERKEKKTEQARAKTKEELIAIGRMRGYKNPAWWAQKVIESRSARHMR